MPGWPARITRDLLGPVYEALKKITNPKQQLDPAILNLIAWQLAGATRCGPIALFKCTVSGAAVTNAAQYLTWDPNGALSPISFGYSGVGVYTFSLAANYPDMNGGSTAISLLGGDVMPNATGNANGNLVIGGDGHSGTIHMFTASTGAAIDSDFALLLF